MIEELCKMMSELKQLGIAENKFRKLDRFLGEYWFDNDRNPHQLKILIAIDVPEVTLMGFSIP